MTAPRILPADATLRVRVVRCSDPYEADSIYVRRFWTGVLGPTPTALLGVLVRDDSRDIAAADVAAAVGVDRHTPRCRKLAAALERLGTFQLVDWTTDNRVYVRDRLPRVPASAIARMPATLRATHDQFEQVPA